MIHVAKHKQTGLFSRSIKDWLYDNQQWINDSHPTDQEVIDEMALSGEMRSLWTTDLQDTDIWVEYDINLWNKYLPDVEFVEVTIS